MLVIGFMKTPCFQNSQSLAANVYLTIWNKEFLKSKMDFIGPSSQKDTTANEVSASALRCQAARHKKRLREDIKGYITKVKNLDRSETLTWQCYLP